ncbi:protein ILITYHIA [Sesamum angolense]|uniref:Protein ILITYHIA n=1 Tax=Sesamum angolense TaxID=2727404 RepID=A0AAE2BTX3_9LAMI|nr:protein ILITYHIA [Sesamum angolense]
MPSDATNPMDSLMAIAPSISTPSTTRRIQIFRLQIPSILNTSDSSQMTTEFVSLLVDLLFQTLSIYDDRGSRKAVDDVIIKALSEAVFLKSFAASLVQAMERHSKFQSLTGSYRLLQWSCLLLIYSQFASLSKNALCRVAQAQASSPDIYKTYMEELKDGRIPYKDSPELIHLMLDYLSSNPASFDKWKDVFLDIYVKAVLNAREKPTKALSEAFIPLFIRLSHEDFKNTILPTFVKMLKRNPEVVLESIGVLLESSNLDLSKYAIEILSVVLTQARHADEGRRLAALAIVRCLSQKSSSPDAVEAMFSAIRSVMGGSEGRLTFPYQRVGMVNALREISNAPEGKYFSSLSPTICGFLLSCYKDDGNEEVKLVTLSCIASWAVKSADAISPDLVTFFASGLKEKEVLRRGCLRCLRLICKNTDAVLQMSPLLLPLLQLVKTGFTKAAQRLDGIHSLLCVVKLLAVDVKADETVSKEKIWQLILQNEPTILPISLTSKLSIEDLMACIDLVEVLVVDYTQRILENLPTRAFMQITATFLSPLDERSKSTVMVVLMRAFPEMCLCIPIKTLFGVLIQLSRSDATNINLEQ